MKKESLFLLFIFSNIFLYGQDLKPLPDCKDLKEKVVAIYKYFDKLPETFKDKETEKKGSRVFYSTQLSLCGVNGFMAEDTGTYSREGKMVFQRSWILQFVLKKNEYNTTRVAFNEWTEKILEVLKQVFVNWEYDFNSESNGSMTYHSFIEKTGTGSSIKKEVDLDIYSYSDNLSMNLIFAISNLNL